MREVKAMIDGKIETLYADGTPFTIHDLVALLEKDVADRGLHTSPQLEYARKLRDEATS
jgi:hypothetical protein